MHGGRDHHYHHHGHHHHDHGHGPGHNVGAGDAVQWQTPHLPEGPQQAPPDDEARDLDLVEKAFRDGFATAPDPTSFLRLAGVPFAGLRADGTELRLLRVEQASSLDIGSLTPHLGGGSFRYDPLPAAMTTRRDDVRFVYFDGAATVSLTLQEARALSSGPGE